MQCYACCALRQQAAACSCTARVCFWQLVLCTSLTGADMLCYLQLICPTPQQESDRAALDSTTYLQLWNSRTEQATVTNSGI